MILVTGGCGYLGSAVVEELLKYGYKIRIVDLPKKHIPEEINRYNSKLEFIKGDITSDTVLQKALSGVDCVVHLAATTNEPRSFKYPEPYFKVNYEGSKKLCSLAGELGVSKFLYCSSCAVYGHLSEKVADESTPPNPKSPYATSKLMGEQACLSLGVKKGLCVIALRIPTLFGRSLVTRLDTLVNRLAYRAARKEELKIHGDGMQIRPVLHVRDAARAFLFALERDIPSGELFNVVGENVRVKDLVSLLDRMVGGVSVNYLPDKHPESYSRPIDSTKFKKLGYETKFTLEDGVREILSLLC